MTPAQLQQICIEAEDLRQEVQRAYRQGMADGDTVAVLRMVREVRLFIQSTQQGNQHESQIASANPGDRSHSQLG